jgi:cytidine deaminase
MVTLGESHISTLVAVDCDGNVLPPCGRCRELISQINPKNSDARVLLPAGRVTTLRKLLPEQWN